MPSQRVYRLLQAKAEPAASPQVFRGALEGAGEQVIVALSPGAVVAASALAFPPLPKEAPGNLDKLGLGPRH